MLLKDTSLIHHFLENSAKIFPDKIALVHEDKRIPYSRINAEANQIAHFLINQGISKGDRIVIILQNSLEYVTSYYGILKVGGTTISLSTDIKSKNLDLLLKEIDPCIIITSKKFEKILQASDLNALHLRAIIISDSEMSWPSNPFQIIQFDNILQNESVQNPCTEIDEATLAAIIYTSGSTGVPKGAMLTHRNIVVNTDSICTYLNLTDKDIQMIVLPFFYVMGKSLLNTHFAAGGTVVINNKSAYPAAVINQMIDEKITGFSGVPSTFAYLLHRSPLKNSRDKLNSLRYCSQAGGHMSRQIKLDLRNTLPDHTKIYIMYGATEASARLSYLDPDQFEKKIDSIGKAIPGVTLKILDEFGNEVPRGTVGELTASGENIMQGYWKDPETTNKVLDQNGYHTGDLAYQDDEGYFYLKGRKDNMLKVSGHKVNPQEIEDIIMETELVIEVIVIGIPDPMKGNKLIGLAVPIQNNSTEKELLEKCAVKLPKYMIPDEIRFLRSLPKKVNGKIDKNKCMELIKNPPL